MMVIQVQPERSHHDEIMMRNKNCIVDKQKLVCPNAHADEPITVLYMYLCVKEFVGFEFVEKE